MKKLGSKMKTNLLLICGLLINSAITIASEKLAASSLLIEPQFQQSTKRYRCNYPLCVYGSDRHGDFMAHQVIHSSEKPFVCPEYGCDYSSRRNCDLKKHSMVHIRRQRISSKHEELESLLKKSKTAQVADLNRNLFSAKNLECLLLENGTISRIAERGACLDEVETGHRDV